MKLPIKKKYFDEIKAGEKIMEFRDAHITFICEETGETLRKNVSEVQMQKTVWLSDELKHSGMFDDDKVIVFLFEK